MIRLLSIALLVCAAAFGQAASGGVQQSELGEPGESTAQETQPKKAESDSNEEAASAEQPSATAAAPEEANTEPKPSSGKPVAAFWFVIPGR